MIDQWVTALKCGDIATAKRLLAEHPELLRQGQELHEPYLDREERDLFEAAATGQTARLARSATGRLAEKGPGGWSVLHLASYFGHLEAVQWLLEAGADANATAARGATPLHLAAAKGRQAIVDTLLVHGAKRERTMDNGQTPADVAAEHGFPTLADALRP